MPWGVVINKCLVGQIAPLVVILKLCYEDKYLSGSQCVNCDVGSYCRGGVYIGICTAGYFCTGGDSNPTTPSELCAVNNYCLHGAR